MLDTFCYVLAFLIVNFNAFLHHGRASLVKCRVASDADRHMRQ